MDNNRTNKANNYLVAQHIKAPIIVGRERSIIGRGAAVGDGPSGPGRSGSTDAGPFATCVLRLLRIFQQTALVPEFRFRL